VVDRPLGAPERAGWLRAPGGAGLPPPELLAPAGAGALVVAHEWLDVVPCPVVEVDGAGVPRVVEVDVVDGTERPGRALGTVESSAGAAEGAADAASAAAAADLDWLRRWWPLAGSPPGTRAEVGRPRDEAWAALVRAASGAVLVAVDYAHAAGARPASGTLAGYRDGRACPPVPDGSCDVTASVALDAVAAAGAAAGAVATTLTTQRAALLALGVPAGRPDPARAVADPRGYLTALQVAGSAAELIDPGGLGSFGWLLQSTGPALPRSLR
jgi:SAM-dependent MidA family methyltransferase